MAKVGDEWKGKAICFDTQSEIRFSSLSQLSELLKDTIKNNLNGKSEALDDPASESTPIEPSGHNPG